MTIFAGDKERNLANTVMDWLLNLGYLGLFLGTFLAGTVLPLVGGARMRVSATFDWPSDGRQPTYGYAIISPGNDTKAYDTCLVRAWPVPDDIESLLRNADAAMYRVKNAGRNGFRFFAEAADMGDLEQIAI